MSKRQAFTLVELMIMLSASSVLMALAVGLVHRSMSASSLAKARANHQRALVRLADQFRNDIHQGDAVDQLNADRLTLRLANGRLVDYVVENRHCRRQESLGDDRRSLETFELLSGARVAFEQDDKPARVTLTVTREAAGHGAEPLVDAHVEAILGRRPKLHNPEATP